jgi:hypothetical protein
MLVDLSESEGQIKGEFLLIHRIALILGKIRGNFRLFKEKTLIFMFFESIRGISPFIFVVFDAIFKISGIPPSIYQISCPNR